MSFTLADIVPWGRSFDEYVAMFALSDEDLGGRILGCGDGPASFNAVLTWQGGTVVSVDPLYRFSVEGIRQRISETFAEVLEQTRQNSQEFLWTRITSVEELGALRLAAMEAFLADYPSGKEQGRYVTGELPRLPFSNGEFRLALCSHLLFLYSKQLSTEFHVASILELCRVAEEVRVFPLLELGAVRSRHLQSVTAGLIGAGCAVDFVPVSYQFQRGGKEAMKIKRPGVACASSHYH